MTGKVNGDMVHPPLHFPAIWIPIAYTVILLLVSPLHSVFNEWGGVMQYFAGREILSGEGYHGWTSHFWPPLFSILIGIGSLVLPGFLAGKVISIVSASVLLFVTFHFAYELSQRRDVALWAQVFLAISPTYLHQALLAHNHLLDSALFGSGLFLFLRALRAPRARSFLVAGVVCGLAGLSRYTSDVLLALPICLLAVEPAAGHPARAALTFWLGFSLICLPWWYANAVSNGSPLHTWEFLNVCSSVVAHQPGQLAAVSWCANHGPAGLRGILTAYPLSYVKNVTWNIVNSVNLLIAYGGALAAFVLPALFEAPLSLPQQYMIPIVAILSLSIFTVSQAFVAEWFLLGWIAPLMVLTTVFVVRYLERVEALYPKLADVQIRKIFLVLLVLGGEALSVRELTNMVRVDRKYVLDGDIDGVSHALKARDTGLASKVIMATDPLYAYYAGSRYIATPLDYEGAFEGLLSSGAAGEVVRNFAPRYPSSMDSSASRPNYLIYTRGLPIAEPPGLSFLSDSKRGHIPGNLSQIYESPHVAVYRVRSPDWGGEGPLDTLLGQRTYPER